MSAIFRNPDGGDELPFLRDMPFAPDAGLPLYRQLYEHLRGAILSGRLLRGTRLPSTRTLADMLGVSRSTALNAYEQLLAEGYLESHEGSGTFVARVLPEVLLAVEAPRHPRTPIAAPPVRVSQRARELLNAPFTPRYANVLSGAFRPGVPALDVFPFDLWAKLLAKHARLFSPNDAAYQGTAGFRPLREAIADHVTVARSVRCTADQVMIVPGSQGGLDLALRVLLDVGDQAWMEAPYYFGAHGALRSAGAQIIPVPVDAEGLIVSEGIRRAPDARVVYVTPSHQMPLGMTMTLRRRLALLEWAQQADAYILEDDYDSEFRFSGRPLAALQGLDETGRVIYVGTFSKVLFPALRLGYIIVPPPLVEAFLAVRRYMDTHAPMLEQQVLAEFLSAGHFGRHIRRMRTLYHERRDLFCDAAQTEGLPLELQAADTGMHLIGWLPPGVTDLTAQRRAADQRVMVDPLSLSCIAPLPRAGLLLGYGGVDEYHIRQGVRRLKTALEAV